jgi:hypothetical protein
MAPFKINHGARQAAEEDRRLGILHVMKGHHALGTMRRVLPRAGLQTAFASYQLLESGDGMREAVRLLMVVA